MQTTLKFIILFCLVGQFQTVEAQLLKRLKNKIENKVEQKIERTVDKTVDDVLSDDQAGDNATKDSNNNTNSTNNNSITTSSVGRATINHGIKYGNFIIDEFGKTKTLIKNEEVRIFGSWVTMSADINDGYVLVVPNGQDILFSGNTPKQNVKLSIPSQATLLLSYDPVYDPNYEDENGFSRAVTKDYQDYELTSGEVNITVLSKDNIQISYSGNAKLVTRTINPDKKAEEKYILSYDLSSISGEINVSPVEIIDERRVDKKESNNQQQTPTFNSGPDLTKGLYQFTHETKVKITDLKSNESYSISYLLNPNADYMAIKANMSDYGAGDVGGESVIVMDGDQTFIFVDAPGMKMQMSGAQMGNQQASNPTEQMENYDYTNLNKTGNTKTIIGYTCYEYVMSDDQNSIQFWVAPELVIPNWFMQNQEVIEGHILEYTVDSKDGKMTVTTLEIMENINKTLNPSEYKKMF
jgi:hypothetical protein